MKIERFDYLKNRGITDMIMFDIVKFRVILSFNMSFNAFALNYAIKHKPCKYPVWEVYLNILIQECGIPKGKVVEEVKKSADAFIEEIENNLKKLLAKYDETKKNN